MTETRILIVDDSALLLEVARVALEAAGYRVATANDMAALDHQRGPFDLVLMDVQMPELFGDDVASVLRHVHGVAAPIYLFSSLECDDLRARVEEAGIDGYISKRDGIERMVARVAEILARRGGGPS